MKKVNLLILLQFVSGFLMAQTVDSTAMVTPAPAENYSGSFGNNANPFERYEIDTKKNVYYKTTNFVDTEIFDKIVYLEMQEGEAVKSRDSLRLMTLWARDFTLDETQSLVSGKSGIPYYISLYRMVEEVTPIDSVTVMCTGIEYQREIGTYHTGANEKKKFFHIWTKYNGVWKLTTRRLQ